MSMGSSSSSRTATCRAILVASFCIYLSRFCHAADAVRTTNKQLPTDHNHQVKNSDNELVKEKSEYENESKDRREGWSTKEPRTLEEATSSTAIVQAFENSEDDLRSAAEVDEDHEDRDAETRALGVARSLEGYSAETAILCDCGSTGTRVYIARGKRLINVGKQRGGLGAPGMENKMTPEKAFAAGLWSLLDKAQTEIAREAKMMRGKQDETPYMTKVAFYGTAGTRLLNEKQRTEMWAELIQQIKKYANYNSNWWELDVATRTIDGSEEGTYAFLSANFLSDAVALSKDGIVFTHLGTSPILDLGGASTQVSFAVGERPNEVVTGEHLFAKSWLRFGAVEFRKRLDEEGVAAPCNFGNNATPCFDAISKVMAKDDSFSDFKSMLERVGGSKNKKVATGISGYFYTVKFGEWFNQDTGSTFEVVDLSTIRKWATNLCAMDFDDVEKKYSSHPASDVEHTTREQLPNRCFDMCYVYVLLSRISGGSGFEFQFVDQLKSTPVDWPLGAYMYLIAGANEKQWIQLDPARNWRVTYKSFPHKLVEWPTENLWILFLIAICGAVCFRKRILGRLLNKGTIIRSQDEIGMTYQGNSPYKLGSDESNSLEAGSKRMNVIE